MPNRRNFLKGGGMAAAAAIGIGRAAVVEADEDAPVEVVRKPRHKPNTPAPAISLSDVSKVDVVFVIDSTGSMGAYIEEAKQRAKTEAEKIAQQGDLDIQFGLVAYRDHPPQDNSFVTQVVPLGTAEPFQAGLTAMTAGGGGDGPEAVWDGLAAAIDMNWRPNSDRHVFLIGDAPPHGVGANGDGFPEGCPCGDTQESIIIGLNAVNAKVFAHSIAGDKTTTKVFTAVAQQTGGSCTVSNTPAAMTASYVGTMTTTSSSVSTASSFASIYNVTSASSAPGTSTATILLRSKKKAAQFGWDATSTADSINYLSERGLLDTTTEP